MKAIIAVTILFATGMNFGLVAAEKNHQRGWIGGEYRLAKREGIFHHRETVQAFPVLESKQRVGIFVDRVPTNTPAATAGLREGDLILKSGDQKMESLRLFRKTIDTATPGSALDLTVWREGELRELKVAVGVETFRHMGTLGFGLHFSGPIDLWPNPDFSLGLLGFKRKETRLELYSPVAKFMRAAGQRPDVSQTPARGMSSHEGWRVWLVVIQVVKNKIILSQEPALSKS